MSKNLIYLISCVILALGVCFAQIIGQNLLILGLLVVFLVLLSWLCVQGITLPILLFFLPWSSLLRLSPDQISFYTVGLVLVCAISVVRSGFMLKKRYIMIGMALLLITLLSQLISGSALSLSYLCFMMLIFLLPSVQQENTGKKYNFYWASVFFAVGIILAAFCAQQFVGYSNIKKYIVVDSYLTITRWCGFYSDPNFYTAQITAALSGVLFLILHSNGKKIIGLSCLSVLLIYCGMLSGSKSFLLVFICIMAVWLILLFRMRGKGSIKLLIYGMLMLVTVFIASSTVFKNLLDIMITRILLGDQTLNGFTTGRIEIWKNYINEIFHNAKILLVGNGMKNALVEGRASHNTIIQSVFQFGFLGVPFMIAWCWNFMQLSSLKGIRKHNRLGGLLMLIVGCTVPWLAIDVLFFDDFFIVQWFLQIGFQFVVTGDAEKEIEAAEKAADVMTTIEKTSTED